MNGTARLIVYFLGLLLILGAIYVLYSTTDLQRIVPPGVAVAVILLILGIGVMAAAGQMRNGARAVTERDTYVERAAPRRDVARVEERRRFEDDDRF